MNDGRRQAFRARFSRSERREPWPVSRRASSPGWYGRDGRQRRPEVIRRAAPCFGMASPGGSLRRARVLVVARRHVDASVSMEAWAARRRARRVTGRKAKGCCGISSRAPAGFGLSGMTRSLTGCVWQRLVERISIARCRAARLDAEWSSPVQVVDPLTRIDDGERANGCEKRAATFTRRARIRQGARASCDRHDRKRLGSCPWSPFTGWARKGSWSSGSSCWRVARRVSGSACSAGRNGEAAPTRRHRDERDRSTRLAPPARKAWSVGAREAARLRWVHPRESIEAGASE
jgi:hypothetical protein